MDEQGLTATGVPSMGMENPNRKYYKDAKERRVAHIFRNALTEKDTAHCGSCNKAILLRWDLFEIEGYKKPKCRQCYFKMLENN